MLFGQNVEVYIDRINLTQDALGLTSDRVYRWRLLIEEYGPKIMYIKGIGNTVADAISRLDYDPALNRHADDEDKSKRKEEKWNNFITLLNHYDSKISDEGTSYNSNYSQVFANNQINDKVFPLTVAEIADAQRSGTKWKLLGYWLVTAVITCLLRW